MKFEWERLEDQSFEHYTHFTTLRAKVIGGWIIRTNEYTFDEPSVAASESLVFVPDPKHEWVIDEQ